MHYGDDRTLVYVKWFGEICVVKTMTGEKNDVAIDKHDGTNDNKYRRDKRF